MSAPVRVTVWNEFRHEKEMDSVRKLYPDGMHKKIADHLETQPNLTTRLASLDEPEHGLTEEVLAETDVLFWWAHAAHHEVQDEIVERIAKRVWAGMGFVGLHSAHFSKPLIRLLGTPCTLKWREAGEKERLWNLEPGHPITAGIGEYFELPETEMYGEPFAIPTPDKLLFISWFQGGEVFRSGAVWERGNGRIFYFRPGHETYPIYYDENVLRVLSNAAAWCAPRVIQPQECPNREPLEPLK